MIINVCNEKKSDFNDIRFNMGAMGILDINPKLMVKFYKAYRKFASLVNSKKYLLKFKLEAGDIFCFNNSPDAAFWLVACKETWPW